MADSRYALSLVGSPSLRSEAGERVAIPLKAFPLVAVLQASPGRRRSRRALADLLYQDVGQSSGLANLRQFLKRLQARQAEIDMRLLASSADEVWLVQDDGNVVIDVDGLCATGVPRNGAEVEALVDHHHAELLEGFEGVGDAFDTWLLSRRMQLRKRYVELLRSCAANLGGSQGERALREVLRLDPYQEEIWRSLLELVWKQDGLEGAERIFHEMSERLRSDLGVAPGGATVGLMDMLRRNHARTTGRASPVRPAETLLRHPSSDPAIGTAVPRLCVLMPPQAPEFEAHLGLVGSLVEDVTLGLCRLRSLAVIAPHTAWRLTEGERSLNDLQLDYVVETNLRNFGGDLRLYVKLVRTSDGVMVSGDAYELSDTWLGHQKRLTSLIVTALADALEQAEVERFDKGRRPDAYQWLLRGRQHMRVLNLPDVRRARKAFLRATESDPLFAPALSGTARTLIMEWLLLSQTDRSLLLEAQSVASRAAALDPFSGEALRDYAGSTLLLGGMDEAKETFAKAERLTPHHADILADHANALSHCSEMDAALVKIRSAIELNPIPPDDYLWTAGGALFFLNDYEGALSYLGRMQRQEPAYRLTAACLAMMGQRREAARFVSRALEDQPNFLVDEWVATIPLRSQAHVEHYAQALSRAGFR